MSYGIPEQVGLSSVKLNVIDSIVRNAILAGAMPGCQVLVARNGKIVYNKAFGTKSYLDLDSVRSTDLYDIASVTKIAATSLAVMKLFDQKKIDLNQPLSKYYPRLKATNKKALTIREILAHQAGLQAWIPFYKQTMTDTSYIDGIYSKTKDSKFSVRVADSLYMNVAYSDSLLNWLLKSPVKDRGKYVYSDLGPILMKLTTEKLTNKPYDEFLNENFYQPLGLKRFGYNPRTKFPLTEIVPTENDQVFRKQIIRGDVHDPAAAMMGGVSGNAGIFSDAADLAVLMQMLLNKGTYGGITYLKPTTVEMFTKTQFIQNNNRRGLLFDKPETDSSKPSPCAKECSPLTFGHQGFTGTCVWVDPQYQLIYIFLSNRVNPDAGNDKLVKLNVRTSIQSAIYKAMMSGSPY
jgi:CubicO group peptidase (beta-lactamase class C family)